MVEERLTDGYRIGELLASEIDGWRSGPLADLAVANADRTVEGTPAGERAYDVRLLDRDPGEASRDPRREPTPGDAGALFAQVFVHERGATLALERGHSAAIDAADAANLDVDDEWDGDALAIRLTYGAQCKRAADVLAAAVEAAE